MSIPFKLNIFKQIEIYQDLKELDDQFFEQLKKDGNEFCKNPPTWFFEKKILHWAYLKHKHLGSPLKISYLSSDEYIRERDSNKNLQEILKEVLIIEENIKDIYYTKEEAKAVQIRKVFGNMEVKGLAKFFKSNENNYWNINQENCDGIFLTAKGLEYARMIYSLYEFRNVKGEYKKIKGAEKVLEIKTRQVIKFTAIITTMFLIILSSIFLFFKTFVSEITDSLLFF